MKIWDHYIEFFSQKIVLIECIQNVELNPNVENKVVKVVYLQTMKDRYVTLTDFEMWFRPAKPQDWSQLCPE